MPTPIFPLLEKRINDNAEKILNFQVVPWALMPSSKPFHVKQFDGREITYEGIEFEGSPRNVFWGRYIEPFLEDMILKEISFATEKCRERELDARLVLPELDGLLTSACQKIFTRMTNIDQRLLSHGYPERIPLRLIQSELAGMNAFIQTHISAELSMWKPKAWYEGWYERNKFWVWLVGTLLAVAGLAAKFL